MKVPEYIKKEIEECADYNNKAKISERIIMQWLERMKLTEDTCTDISKNMEDYFIDCCKIGCNASEFIEILENLK